MSVADFYVGKTVLLTGATGFLGKVLLEKLLWHELGARPLRLLVRGDPALRLRELTDSVIFSRLRERCASKQHDFLNWFHSQVNCYSCDLEADDLGLCSGDSKKVFGSVDIAIHCAARVSWDERLDVAIKANTVGTHKLFTALADEASSGNPPTFVHISSTFVHGMAPAPHAEVPLSTRSIREQLDETTSPNFDIEKLVKDAIAEGIRVDSEFAAAAAAGHFTAEARARLAPGAGTEEVSALELRISERRARLRLSQSGIDLARSHGWWDPYTLSKAMGEILLGAESKKRGIPLVIVRPSGIISCAQEPSPGWIDCYLLNEPIIEATGRGQLTAFPGREDSVLDMVPADFVVNLIIVSSTKTSTAGSEPLVYQAASGDVNPVHQGDLARWWFEYFCEHPFLTGEGKPIKPVQPKLLPSLEAFLRHMYWSGGVLLPAASFVVQSLPKWMKWSHALRSRVGKLQSAIDNATRLAALYSVYTIERFEFKSVKSRALLNNLPENDRMLFNLAGCEDIDWKAYFTDLHIPGMRKYVLNETGLEPLPASATRALSRRSQPRAKL